MNDITNPTPVSEDDMNMVRKVFTDMADHVIGYTTLSKSFHELEAKVNDLAKEVDHLRSTNAWLDEQLTRIRGERDAAQEALRQRQSELNMAQSDASFHKSRAEAADATIASLQEQVASLRKERDDYGVAQMQAEDALKEANAKLAKLRELLGLPAEANPVPVPQAPPAMQQAGELEQAISPWLERPTDNRF